MGHSKIERKSTIEQKHTVHISYFCFLFKLLIHELLTTPTLPNWVFQTNDLILDMTVKRVSLVMHFYDGTLTHIPWVCGSVDCVLMKTSHHGTVTYFHRFKLIVAQAQGGSDEFLLLHNLHGAGHPQYNG